mgnify:CR=1 FL=1
MTPTPDRNDENTRTNTADAPQPETDADDEAIAESLGTLRMRRFPLVTHWQRAGALLEPNTEDVDGIEIEDVESPDEEDLRVGSDADLVLSVSGEDGAVRIETDAGHEVVLNDKSGSESISITDKSDNSIEMDSVSNEISISAGQSISMEAPTIELAADGEVKIESDGKVEMSGKGQASVSSKGQLSLESNGLMGINATGPLTIEGAIIQLN